MKRKTLNQIASLGLSLALIGGTGFAGSINAMAAVREEAGLQYVAISKVARKLTISSTGEAFCSGTTAVRNGYIADVYVELQQYDGGWNTIKHWSDNDWDYANVEENWYVESGYKYRVKVTHKSFDSNGNQLEKTTTYSSTVTY